MQTKPRTYLEWIESLSELQSDAAAIQQAGSFDSLPLPVLGKQARTIVVCSPHPDDEAIVGLLPYRLRLEGWRVVNLAMTLGSRASDHGRRRFELERSCARLGFEAAYPFSDLSGRAFRAERGSAERSEAIHLLREVIGVLSPTAVLAPHLEDAHPTHIAVGELVRDVLDGMKSRPRYLFESEFWSTMTDPSLSVEATPAQLADLVSALAEHVGEIRRNPYHLLLPAWMQDAARRGAELVGGFGNYPPRRFHFASLYRAHLLDEPGRSRIMEPSFWSSANAFDSR